jgi:hypothetical protein
MVLSRLTNYKMQHMRSLVWEGFLTKVTLFCKKHSIEVPSREKKNVAHEKLHRYYSIMRYLFSMF